MIEEGQKI